MIDTSWWADLGRLPFLTTDERSKVVAICGCNQKRAQAPYHLSSLGHAHVVCISSEAGIGKTRLAEELLTWARHQGIAQVRTRSYADAGSLAYGPTAE